jgi:hypothetical protein
MSISNGKKEKNNIFRNNTKPQTRGFPFKVKNKQHNMNK